MYWQVWRGLHFSAQMRRMQGTIASVLVLLVLVRNMYTVDVEGLTTNHAPAMFIFGDSLADVGNNNYIPFSSFKANFYPHGIDFAKRTPTGRFCNGRLVLDVLATRLGYPVPLPYLSPNTRGLALLQGVNYASAGCGILNETSYNSNGCLSLSTQLGYHTKTVKRIVGEIGDDETKTFLTKSLYFVVIGSNDFLGNFLMNNSRDSKLYSPMQFIDRLLSSLAKDFMMLYNQSARRMVLVGLGPLGCIPSQRAKDTKGACNKELNNLVHSLNEASQTLVRQLDSKYSDAMITFANPYNIFMQIPSAYGFNVTVEACCGGGRMNAQTACLPLSTVCSNRSSHLFWDAWHPTEAVNVFVADALLSPRSTLVAPWSIHQLALIT